MNAGTDKELTVYWAKVGDHRFAATLDILADSLLNSLLDPLELEKEREVILEELAMTEDSPADIVNILIDEVVWPHQPLGRDTGGTPDSVRATKRDDSRPLHGAAVRAPEHRGGRGRQRDPRRSRRPRDRVPRRLASATVWHLVSGRDPRRHAAAAAQVEEDRAGALLSGDARPVGGAPRPLRARRAERGAGRRA